MPTTPRVRRVGALGVALSLFGGGCTHSGSAVRVRRASNTTVEEVTGKVTGRGEPGAEQATPDRFDVGKDASVLVPIGALDKGVELRVRRLGAASLGTGAIEGGDTRFEVATTGGLLHKPIAVQIRVASAAEQSRPVAVVHDEASDTWLPVTADYADGSLTIYAPKAGAYSWVHWNWRTAAAIAAQTARAVATSGVGGGPSLSCPPQDETTATVTATPVAPPTGSALRWCVGGTAGRPELQLGNASTVPLSLLVTGVPGATASSGQPLIDDVAAAARGVPGVATDGALTVLVPGATARFELDPAVNARAALAPNGFSRAVVTMSAAMGAAVGLRAGTFDAATAALDRAEVRRAVLGDLTADACAPGLGAALAGAATDQLGTAVLRLTGCLTPATSALVADAAGASVPLRRVFGTQVPAAPGTSTATLAADVLATIEPLVGNGRGGDVVIEPRSPVGAVAPTPFVVPATAAPTVVVPVGAAVSPTTTSAGKPATTTTTARPTPPVTPPSAPTPTTRPAPPVPAPTTTSPTPVATPAPTTAAAVPTTPAPVPAAPVTALSSDRCSRDRGSVALTTTGLTPSASYSVLLISPDRRVTTTTLTATPTGETTDVISCDGARRGTWRVVVRDDTTTGVSVELSYTVR